MVLAMLVRARALAASRFATAVIALVVVVAAQLAGAAHEAAVRHVACAQHGELIEAPELDPSREAPAGEEHFGRAGTGGDHEHCVLASALRQHGISTRPPVVAATSIAIAPLLAPPIDGATPARSIISLAPKTSPPAFS